MHGERNEGGLIFDYDSEQQPSSLPTEAAPPASAVQEDTSTDLLRDLVDNLSDEGLMGDETVIALKRRMGGRREGVKGRRLRLIHAGKILRDGVRLVAYLEELDLRNKVQSRQTLRHLALDSDRTGSDVKGGADEDEESDERSEDDEHDEDADESERRRDEVERRELTIRQLVDLLSNLNASGSGEEASHTSSGGREDPPPTQQRMNGKGKSREPPFYDDLIRLIIRTAPTVYLQCSVGDIEIEPSPSPSPSQPDPLIDISHDSDQAPGEHEPAPGPEAGLEGERNRGFNRLLDAGLSPTEISSIRTQFRTTHPLPHHYDLIQEREHAQHLLEMEESWMDTFSNPNAAQTLTLAGGGELGDFADPSGGRGAYTTVMQGLMVGFFMPPLIPLFWFRDKPHPSSLPSTGDSATGGETDAQAAATGRGDDGGGDDEEEWERERTNLTRESVFASTMQVSILCGLIAK